MSIDVLLWLAGACTGSGITFGLSARKHRRTAAEMRSHGWVYLGPKRGGSQ